MLPGLVTIFSKTTCGHCKKAKELLSTKASFVRVNVLQLDELDPGVREWMLENTEQAKTVPQIFLNDEWLPGGASNLLSLEEKGILNELLHSKLAQPLDSKSALLGFMVATQNQQLNAAIHGDLDF